MNVDAVLAGKNNDVMLQPEDPLRPNELRKKYGSQDLDRSSGTTLGVAIYPLVAGFIKPLPGVKCLCLVIWAIILDVARGKGCRAD